jgi:hypothetical protein
MNLYVKNQPQKPQESNEAYANRYEIALSKVKARNGTCNKSLQDCQAASHSFCEEHRRKFYQIYLGQPKQSLMEHPSEPVPVFVKQVATTGASHDCYTHPDCIPSRYCVETGFCEPVASLMPQNPLREKKTKPIKVKSPEDLDLDAVCEELSNMPIHIPKHAHRKIQNPRKK